MAEIYDNFLVPAMFAPFAADLSGRVASYAPARVLELAAGTGGLTRELCAALPGVDIVATDLNPAMVDRGQQRVPTATWRQADAQRLPFADATFDVTACQFGVMFVPDRAAAYAETRRVLVPGGRVVLAVWSTIAEHAFAAALVDALEAVFPDDPPTFVVRVPHGYADPAVVHAELAAAGFDQIAVDTVTLKGHAASTDDLVTGFCLGTPLRAALATRRDLAQARAEVARAMTERLGPGPCTARMTAHVVTAARPIEG